MGQAAFRFTAITARSRACAFGRPLRHPRRTLRDPRLCGPRGCRGGGAEARLGVRPAAAPEVELPEAELYRAGARAPV